MQRTVHFPWAAVVAIALAAIVLRALAFSGTELYSDEAYYWLWSLRPAAGYFDHPPLVAWLVAAGSPLLAGELGVRAPFLLAGGLTVVFAALLAAELAAPEEASRTRAALYGALLTAAAPLLNVVGAMALPDAPLAAAYTAALWLIARARGTRWIWAGAAVGVALLAKYTAALLAPALVIALLWDRELRRDLRSPWPWLGAVVAVVIFAPCLAWNALHDWVSIRFQLGHGFANNASVRSFIEYAVGQIAGLGPVALIGGVFFLVAARTSPARRVAAAALMPIIVTTWSALRGKVEANWPAMVYPALCAAAAVALARARPRVSRALVAASVVLTIASLAFFGAEQRRPRFLSGTAAISRFHGWKAMAAEARALARQACGEVGCEAEQPFLVCASYQYASELAYYGGFRRFGPAVERPSQLDVWGERPAGREPVVFVGVERPGGGEFRLLRADGQRETAQRTIAYQGEPLRQLAVTPFSRYAGDVPRG